MNFYIYYTNFNYEYLDQKGFQLALPPKCLSVLKQSKFDTELFASPFNNNYKKYYSLFETDKNFGSKGNYIQIIKQKKGCYEVNPPFLESVFE